MCSSLPNCAPRVGRKVPVAGGGLPMGTRLLLQELTREEARTAAPEALAIFPVGATEQHGPHLPVYT
ncbi:MAG: creatininase family protein, partial [bacterium]